MKVRSRHSSKKSPWPRVLLVSLVVIILGLVLPTIITKVSQVIIYPVHITQKWLRESPATFPSYLRDRDELIERISTLENELAIAVSTDNTQQRLYEENIWLRDLLGGEPESRIAAAVIARPAQLPYDLLQIDRGSDSGVVVGAPVYVGSDNVIGTVVQVTDSYSFVQLFTTPGFKATAFISGANVVAEIEGHGGGVARVRVPQGIAISVGNLVYVPSLDPGVFGRISHVENRPSQPEQYGFITLQEPVSAIHYVAVGRKSIQPTSPEAIDGSVARLIEESLRLKDMPFKLVATSTASSSENTDETSN